MVENKKDDLLEETEEVFTDNVNLKNKNEDEGTSMGEAFSYGIVYLVVYPIVLIPFWSLTKNINYILVNLINLILYVVILLGVPILLKKLFKKKVTAKSILMAILKVLLVYVIITIFLFGSCAILAL